jgi:hypothetical protein
LIGTPTMAQKYRNYFDKKYGVGKYSEKKKVETKGNN